MLGAGYAPVTQRENTGRLCSDATIGACYGPKIFAGTPFEGAPVLSAEIEIVETADAASAKVVIDGFVVEIRLSDLSPLWRIARAAGSPMPFVQQGIEAHVGSAQLQINGEEIALTALPYDPSVGGASVWSPGGTCTR
jgi:hypothetical protein